MSSYQKAVWVPKINEKYFMFLSCNEYNYVLRDYIGDKEQTKKQTGNSSELPELIKKTRPRLTSKKHTERKAWRDYLLNLSKELESDKNQEDIEDKLREVLARRERYDLILKTLCEDARDDQIIYEKIIVHHCPKDRFPPNCKEVCKNALIPLYQKGENRKAVKRMDFCGIVNGRVRILIEEELISDKYKEYLDTLLSCKFMKAKDSVKRDLTNVILFIVENSVKPPDSLQPNKAFSHIIICNNEDFPNEYEKIKGYI